MTFELYPNPSMDEVILEFTQFDINEIQDSYLIAFPSNKRINIVVNNHLTRINTSSLNKGIYKIVIYLQGNERPITKTLLIN